MIATGARSRRVVVRGGGEAATGRMLGVAAWWACWRVVPTGWQSNPITDYQDLGAAIGNRRRLWSVAAQTLSRCGQDKTPAMGFQRLARVE